MTLRWPVAAITIATLGNKLNEAFAVLLSCPALLSDMYRLDLARRAIQKALRSLTR